MVKHLIGISEGKPWPYNEPMNVVYSYSGCGWLFGKEDKKIVFTHKLGEEGLDYELFARAYFALCDFSCNDCKRVMEIALKSMNENSKNYKGFLDDPGAVKNLNDFLREFFVIYWCELCLELNRIEKMDRDLMDWQDSLHDAQSVDLLKSLFVEVASGETFAIDLMCFSDAWFDIIDDEQKVYSAKIDYYKTNI